jgi:sulfide:quinone oxidoreductase
VIGEYPFPAIGPMGLLKDTKFNHISKLLFKWAYYNLLLAGTWLGPPSLQLAGKRLDMIKKK